MGKIKAILFAVFLATASILFAVTNTYANEVCVAAGAYAGITTQMKRGS